MNKKVSIVVAVYNIEPYIKRCINSLLKQTYKNIEIILVDDCSTDNSLEICYNFAKKDKRIKVIEKETHTFVSDVRNIGIDNATGEYIMLVDGDDYASKDYVKEMVKAIEEHDVDLVRCKAFKCKDNEIIKDESIYGFENKTLRGIEAKKIAKNNYVLNEKHISMTPWRLIIRRDKLKTRFNVSLYCAQDKYFFAQLILESVSSIYFLDKFLYYYCYNEKSISNNVDNVNKYIDSLVILDKYYKKLLSKHKLLNDKLEQDISYSTFHYIRMKIYSLSNCGILKIRKAVKTTYENKYVKEIINNIDKKVFSFKWRVFLILIKLHLYTLIAIYIKVFKKK